MSSANASTVPTIKNFIGGEWVESTSTEFIDVPNPSNGTIIARVPLATREETAAAIDNAAETFKTWSRVSVIKRAKILFTLQQLLERDKDELGDIITAENGKPHDEAVAEVGRGIENVMHAASIPNLLMGDSLSTVATDVEVTNYRYPIGVTSAICPFNFPMMVPFWMFPMAIACGNTMVLKPSEKTPNLMNKIVDLVVEAGLPAGVLNIVQGAKDVVNELLENPTVKSVSFVGSEGVGRYVYEHGTANFKRVQALTGAKNHTIVLSDADIADTVTKTLSGGFGSAGERCMAGSVILVEDGVADEFIAKFTEAAEAITMGDTTEEDYYLGPVIRKENQQRTFKYIEDGVKAGAKLILDGREGVPEDGLLRPSDHLRACQPGHVHLGRRDLRPGGRHHPGQGSAGGRCLRECAPPGQRGLPVHRFGGLGPLLPREHRRRHARRQPRCARPGGLLLLLRLEGLLLRGPARQWQGLGGVLHPPQGRDRSVQAGPFPVLSGGDRRSVSTRRLSLHQTPAA
jgi:malonate-semialdehyde dehydrogenase (acetylating)/methylmalonate-semialdehyde dehydrogenase